MIARCPHCYLECRLSHRCLWWVCPLHDAVVTCEVLAARGKWRRRLDRALGMVQPGEPEADLVIRATLELSCGGCDATLTVRGRYVRNRTQVSAHIMRVDAPALELEQGDDDWVWFDPYTNTQYCPACWASIEAP